MAIRIIVDSASDISQKEAQEQGIILVPLTVLFGDKEYRDGVDLLPKRFYELLVESDELPKTSQITAYAFEEVFKSVVDNGDQAIVITISSKLSGTYNSAVQASKKFEGKIAVVDSMSAAIGERLLCQFAKKIVEKELTLFEIKDTIEKVRKNLMVMGVLETLEYLKKGGRISSAVAFVGNVLSIKPVVKIVDGEIKMIGKALGSKKGNNLLNTTIKNGKGIDFSMPYGVVWSGFDDTLMRKYVNDSAHIWQEQVDNIPSYMLGATIGTHVGPGVVAVGFFEKE